MRLYLSREEKDYLSNNECASYLLLKHPRFSSVDKYKVFDENGKKQYFIKTKGFYRKNAKKSQTLVITDKSNKILGKLRWDTDNIVINTFYVEALGKEFTIDYDTKPTGKWIFRKSYYAMSIYGWTLEDSTIINARGNQMAKIDTITKYGNARDSYLITRFYGSGSSSNDILALLFWAVEYIDNAYKENHKNTIFGKVNERLCDRENSIRNNQERAEDKIKDKADDYISEKKDRYKEKENALSDKQRFLRKLLKIAFCLVVPFLGVDIIASIPRSIIPVRFDLLILLIIIFIVSVLGVNYRNPERVVFYEWFGMIILLLFGLILGRVVGIVVENLLQVVGIQGIKVSLPLCLVLSASILKWKSRHLSVLVKARPLFTFLQFVSLGLIIGNLIITFIDMSGRLTILIGTSIMLMALLLSVSKIIVRTVTRCGIFGCALGIILESVLYLLKLL